ncbi:DUF5666 domain-containing protein [Myxococcus landrumensis]|uniref:DUF5666 domain-containing protein n=1 Tax=Myxococcus landrumensis TaxID=2813577 RepID=A0ABX7NJH0_9BACT|nr:DUF5666 domain-containing protein [Myxococcus landrumus]QSQ17629.1 hypothetical protein JY572_16980 [Myxococcus landrumus]
MKTSLFSSRFTPAALLALTLLAPAMALAHGKDGVHVMGTVKEVKQGTLVVETSEKQQEEVMTDASTRYEKSGADVTAADLKTGERVVVHGMKMKNGQVHAQLVKFGKPKADAKGAQPAPAAGGHDHGHAGH